MGIKSKTHFHTPYKSRWWKCAWLEQVTRVELAGNSLGSCRHTARRHLHFVYLLYMISPILSTIFHAFKYIFSFLTLKKRGFYPRLFFLTIWEFYNLYKLRKTLNALLANQIRRKARLVNFLPSTPKFLRRKVFRMKHIARDYARTY